MKIFHIRTSFLFLLMVMMIMMIASPATVCAQRYPIIPYPRSLTPANGDFIITPSTFLVLPEPSRFKNEADALNEFFRNSFGKVLRTAAADAHDNGPKDAHPITFKYDEAIKGDEGYGLAIGPKGVVLSARTPAGMFMAVQTIRQLLPASVEHPAIHALKRLTLPGLIITDEPAYAWRGMHLDVSRHFFSLAYLRKFIDIMALYKLNRFHLHLTDDQGWRIEIKKYPRLTENGAWRTFNSQDSACMRLALDNPDFAIDPAHIIHKNGETLYGGFYTQDEMRSLVAYAAARHIDIIPEIDMPGHMMAAINQYPTLSCDGTSGFGQLFSTPICPCLPTTFQFAQDVYSEILDIFPSKYIHIGGDEVDRSLWAKSEECKALMEKEGLKNTAELQSYFINKMEKFFNSKGRKLIGWDEVLEGGISKTAMIMYWRTWVPRAPVEAARNGNQVIMTPGNPLYFDGFQDKNSLPNVYHFQVIPPNLTEAEAKNIIGAQANIWTEMIPTENRAEYMYMPRLTALAEVLWTDRPDYDGYLQRLMSNYGRLDELAVHYRLPDLPGLLSLNVFTDQDTLWIKSPLGGLTIRYTTDSSTPNLHSMALNRPLIIRQSETVRVSAFRPDGSRGDIYTMNYQRQTLADPENVKATGDGLICSQYKGQFRSASRMPDRRPDTVITVQAIEVPKAAEAPSFGLKYRGWLDIPQDGVYSFYLTCDDGGTLRIANRDVIDNDGHHPPIEKDGQVALKKGLQPIALDFIEGGGGYTLKLKYSFAGSPPSELPAQWLKNASSQAPPKPYGVLPTATQLAWHETEMYCLIHFGVDTYTNKEWGYGDEDPAIVNPLDFDAAQIVGAARAGGFKGVVVVAKHHDGLCLWPTKTTEHNISKSPWRDGKGDMVKEYQLACEKLGMRLGIYCSPWDRNNPLYGTPAYVQTYRSQLKELYANYGPLFMSWHDGANGGDGYYGGARETRNIDRTTYYGWDSTWAITRQLQPGAAIFGDVGPDVRWVGNEEGHAGLTCWATYTPRAPDPGKRPANGYSKYEEATEGTRNGECWMPAECDVPLRPGWFYHASQDQQVKSPYQLLDLYYQSVGRGASLDLGIAPNRRGLLDQRDVASLKAFGDLLRQTFDVNQAKGAKLTASNIRGNNSVEYGLSQLTDNDRYSYWATDDSVTTAQLTIDLRKPTTFNVIRLRENIKLGQRIGAFVIEADEAGQWRQIGAGTSIGANRLIRLQQNVVTDKVRLSITQSAACIALSDFGLFKEPAHLVAPSVYRDKKDLVSITTGAPVATIRYTLDGTEPGPSSPLYKEPFPMPGGGIIKARSFEADHSASEVSTRLLGLSKSGWKVMGLAPVPASASASGRGRSKVEWAIDDDERTVWSTLQRDSSAVAAFPQELSVDMGKVQTIRAFTYLPRQDKRTEGTADRYIFYTSEDGTSWQAAAKGEFANIRSNPLEQLITLGHPLSTRYFKFSILHVVGGNGVVVAEVGVR